MDEEMAFREMISRILTLQPGDDAVVAVKIDICRKYRLPAVPKNSAILAVAQPADREILRKILLVKPTRTLSGVAPVAVMTSPAPMPPWQMPAMPGWSRPPVQIPAKLYRRGAGSVTGTGAFLRPVCPGACPA